MRNADCKGRTGMFRQWTVVRIEDAARLGHYLSKPEALEAAGRFSADGCRYEVVEEIARRGPVLVSSIPRHGH
jgi:hypothetical protein